MAFSMLPDSNVEYTDESESGSDVDEEQAPLGPLPSEKESELDEEFRYDPEPPAEGMYGMAVASIIIDYRSVLLSMSDEEPTRQMRYCCRFILAMVLTLFTISLQMYLTIATKLIVTPEAVRELREAYGEYEFVMYDNHTSITRYGHHRGLDAFYNISNYNLMGEDKMRDLCTCSLSQPVFLFAVLLVWTVTCLAYMRQTVSFTYRLVQLGTASSMKDKDVLKVVLHRNGQKTGKRIVEKVTICTKVMMIGLVQMPVLAMNAFLLWIGCRWLVATLGFGEILLNAVALEFVLNLHEIFYRAIVPYTMKISLASILLPQDHDRKVMQKPTWFNNFSAFAILILAIAWTGLYIRFQQVLPDYNWDIAPACSAFMSQAHFIPHGE